MKLAQLIQELIDEAKQVGLLYHYTSPGNYRKIMDSNMLKGTYDSDFVGSTGPRRQSAGQISKKSISFTRNKNLHKDPLFVGLDFGKGIGRPTVRLTIDGDKLSQKYKIIPFRYFYDKTRIQRDGVTDEYETRINTDSIPNIKDYILKVDDVWEQTQWNQLLPFYIDSANINAYDGITGQVISRQDAENDFRRIETLPPTP